MIDVYLSDMQGKSQHPFWEQSIVASSQSGASNRNSQPVKTEKDDEALGRGKAREREEIKVKQIDDHNQKLNGKKKSDRVV